MSESKTMVVIEPPRRICTESLRTEPFVCPYCLGRGGFSTTTKPAGWTVCPDCGGAGAVRAMITIEWKAAKKRNE